MLETEVIQGAFSTLTSDRTILWWYGHIECLSGSDTGKIELLASLKQAVSLALLTAPLSPHEILHVRCIVSYFLLFVLGAHSPRA